MGNVVRSLAFYAVFYGVTVLFLLAAMAALPLGPERFRKVPDAWSAFHRWCVEHILCIRVVEEGQRPEGPAFYAFKHESFFEAIDIARSLHRPAPFAKEELFRIPLWGKAARAYGAVPVAREQGAKALRFMLSEAKALAATGRPLAIFPEGTRVPHGKPAPLRAGFAGLYKVLGLPVVPVAVNSGPLYHRLWKRKGTIVLRFGEAIPPDLPRKELEERVGAAINALNP
ncbi:1-acyl-sn-glycerol-3-phosphate acyltransferase [Altererythrobacter sp. CC-YST694]|uniref:lysophospholipid acyltransferase family protein n=1 Tax=Altererythrobacter sp. CC-YST694 TaxID=2755038 RepID=UPI001D02B943|nr:lysophospholipid acyltransferase family protein [Altererythrobacter sp. CC-YST694]MCB5426569.1 1-acyl-sn-glycerol-3-phosphate acyltransferase [Altererythrobacter sp. CC-YST694]